MASVVSRLRDPSLPLQAATPVRTNRSSAGESGIASCVRRPRVLPLLLRRNIERVLADAARRADAPPSVRADVPGSRFPFLSFAGCVRRWSAAWARELAED